MCVTEKSAPALRMATMTYIPNWDPKAIDKNIELAKHVKQSYENLRFLIRECNFKYFGARNWIYSNLYYPAMVHTSESLKKRIENLMDSLFKDTVANADVDKLSGCFKGKLMAKLNGNENKLSEEATVELAAKLRELMVALGDNSIDGALPTIY